MLRLRICPQCQEEIYSPKSYFCHRCGAELPSPQEVEESPVPVETRHAASLPPEGRKRYPALRLIFAIVVVVLITAAGIGIYYLFPRSSKPSVPATPPNEAFVPKLLFPVENHPFSAKGLSGVVPAEVDLYLEGNQPEQVLPVLISSEGWGQIERILLEAVGLNPTEAASFLEDEFGVITESTSSAFLARVKDVDFLQAKVSKLELVDGWQARLLQGYLVVYNSEKILSAIESAMKKMTLNLSLVADFVGARRSLPSSGQLFYYGTRRLEFIPESLTGNAFVIARKGKGTLITGL